jgi:prolyl-tRNA editing enzyme YbaK/EbsC (Cys-tRNA(Pro) deacylase)
MDRVFEYLLGHAHPFLVLPAPGAATAEDTARTHGIERDELVRTEVVITTAGPVLMAVPDGRALDLALAQTAVRDPGARPATDAEVRAVAPGCEPGALPPIALDESTPMFVDPAVAAMRQIAFPVGRAAVIVVMQREDLLGVEPSVVVPLTRASVPAEPVFATSRRAMLDDADLPPVHMADGPAAG